MLVGSTCLSAEINARKQQNVDHSAERPDMRMSTAALMSVRFLSSESSLSTNIDDDDSELDSVGLELDCCQVSATESVSMTWSRQQTAKACVSPKMTAVQSLAQKADLSSTCESGHASDLPLSLIQDVLENELRVVTSHCQNPNPSERPMKLFQTACGFSPTYLGDEYLGPKANAAQNDHVYMHQIISLTESLKEKVHLVLDDLLLKSASLGSKHKTTIVLDEMMNRSASPIQASVASAIIQEEPQIRMFPSYVQRQPQIIDFGRSLPFVPCTFSAEAVHAAL